MQYVSKPQTVQAMQWQGKGWSNFKKWFDGLEAHEARLVMGANSGLLTLRTELMEAVIKKTDWVICNAKGVVFMAHDAAFREHYAVVDEPRDPEGGTHENPLGA